MRILIAEDDPVSGLLLESTLGEMGHEVESCGGGVEAWEAFQRGKHPVLVTDWMMPRLDGLELCRRIRRLPPRPYTYVILLTGRTVEGSYREAIEAGVDDFLAKPLDRDLLEARLIVAERIVGLHGHARQLESLLRVCAWCRQIRDGQEWISLERFMERSGTPLTHGICETCRARLEQG